MIAPPDGSAGAASRRWETAVLAFLIAPLVLLAAGSGAVGEKSIFGAPPSTPGASFGEIVGSIELIAGVPATNCIVRVDGTARGAQCDPDGSFRLRSLAPGVWHLTITVTPPATGQTLTQHTIASTSPGVITSLPPIPMTHPITIGGRVGRVNTANWGLYYVAVSALGLAAPLSPSGTFILSGLPPGMHHLELRAFSQQDLQESDARTTMNIEVRPGPVTLYSGLQVPFAPVRATPSGPPGLQE